MKSQKKFQNLSPERTDDEFLKGILNDEWTFYYLQNISLEGLIKLVNAANYYR